MTKRPIFNQEAINTIRLLAVEAITTAKSGHPGIALGAAPTMYVLFNYFLNVDVNDPKYFNRDRFVLSAGHGSALLYATMLVCGYKSITMEDLKNFRQLHSNTPAHPERHLLPGVDLGTGPLGQGVGASVGMAMAEAHLSAYYKLENNESVIDHYTYCLLGDGDLEEGVSSEALALAGRYKLNKLIFLYDSNDVQLDGPVSDSTKINVKYLCMGYGINYLRVNDGADCQQIYDAIAKAKKSNLPTLIEIKTVLGYGSNIAGSNKAHGAPLSWEQIQQLRDNLQYSTEPWTIPEAISNHFAPLHERGNKHHEMFDLRVKTFLKSNSENGKSLLNMLENDIMFDPKWFDWKSNSEKQSTRELSGMVLNKFAEHNKHILILNNDISSSTKIFVKNTKPFDVDSYQNQNINLGVREFASGTIALGIEAHGGCKPIASTFLSFADYAKPAIRLSAINQVAPIFVFSHDSITVGQDGPTHQPVEQLTMLRSIPNVNVFRPSNLSETVIAFQTALASKNSPTVIVTSRITFEQYDLGYESVQKYATEIKTDAGNDQITIAATGSEVALAMTVSTILKDKYQLNARVVSINCLRLFCQQPVEFQKTIWGSLPIFIIEFGTTGWWKQFSKNVFGVDNFGLSAPTDKLLAYLQLTPEAIADQISKKIN